MCIYIHMSIYLYIYMPANAQMPPHLAQLPTPEFRRTPATNTKESVNGCGGICSAAQPTMYAVSHRRQCLQ